MVADPRELADLYISFRLDNSADVQKALDSLQKQTQDFATTANTAGQQIASSFQSAFAVFTSSTVGVAQQSAAVTTSLEGLTSSSRQLATALTQAAGTTATNFAALSTSLGNVYASQTQAALQGLTVSMQQIGAAARTAGGSVGAQFAAASQLAAQALASQLIPNVRAATAALVAKVAAINGYTAAQTAALRNTLAWYGGLTQLQEGLGRLRANLAPVTQLAAVGFARLENTVLGFVRAGLAGTVQGEMLSLRMQMLSQQIASIFLPVIEKLMDYLEQAVDWFRSLSGEQQDNLLKLTLWVGGGLLAISMLGKLVGVIQLATGALRVLIATMTAATAALGAIGLAVVAVTAGLAALAYVYIENKDALDDWISALLDGDKRAMESALRATTFIANLWGNLHTANLLALREQAREFNAMLNQAGKKPREDVTARPRGFEGIEQTYRRIAEATRLVGRAKEKVEVEGLDGIQTSVDNIGDQLARQRPVVGN